MADESPPVDEVPPWPPVPTCECSATPTVELRDRVGAELRCPSCDRQWAVWFTEAEQAALDAYFTDRLLWRLAESS